MPTSHPPDHLQAIANTAGFHFATIEQGGTSLYPSLAQRVSDPEVLRVLLSIGPTETMHFQTWSDKAGNAPPLTDPKTGLVFPDLNKPPFDTEHFDTNLIMPEPTIFLSRKFDHPPHRDRGGGDGGPEVPDRRRAISGAVARVLQVYETPRQGGRRGATERKGAPLVTPRTTTTPARRLCCGAESLGASSDLTDEQARRHQSATVEHAWWRPRSAVNS
jgi:hypothetical protein